MDRVSRNGCVTEYWVVFTQGRTHWITRWLKPNFSHIYLYTRDQYNWIFINPTRLYLQLVIPPVRANQPLTAPFLTGPSDTVIRVKFRARNDAQQYGSFGPLNCVTWTKYILGLRVWCFTPHGLYRKLIALSRNRARMEAHGVVSIERVQG